MTRSTATPIRVAILDLYNNEPNEGMRCIREMLVQCDGRFYEQPITFDVFETRYKAEAPGLDYDVYVSTGGPGSPFEGEGMAWEDAYFGWLDAVWQHNARPDAERKHVLFICHSFQIMARFFGFGEVRRRRQESFGIFKVHSTEAGLRDPLFRGLGDPFYAADFRHFEVVQPREDVLRDLGAEIIALEKERPHVPYERAVMGVRLSPELVGVQFHPEADPLGMSHHFRAPERRTKVVEKVGEARYERLLHRLDDPNYLARTHDAVLPNFIERAVRRLRPEAALRHAA